MLDIKFWSKDSGILMSHSTGLTNEQVQMFRELREGDRLVLWHNKRVRQTDPSYTLKRYIYSRELLKENDEAKVVDHRSQAEVDNESMDV